MEETAIVRAGSLPIARPLNAGWDVLDPLLRACWDHAGQLANWALTELYTHDVRPIAGSDWIPPYPGLYLYGHAREYYESWGWWAGAYAQANCVLRSAEDAYKRQRLAVLRGLISLRTMRLPQPFPLHNQTWEPCLRDGRPVVSLSLPGGRVEVELRGGAPGDQKEFARHLALFRALVAGEAKKCQLLITGQRCSKGCHRAALAYKEPGGGQTYYVRPLVKFVVRMPARPAEGGRVLTLCTDPEAFWVAELDGRRAWVLNNDHVRGAVARHAGHKARLRRLGQDAKAERRLNHSQLRRLRERVEKLCHRHNHWLKTWLQQTAADLAGFAARQRVGEVAYSDAVRDFVPEFPWHRLKTALAGALAGAGITLHDLNVPRGGDPDVPREGE